MEFVSQTLFSLVLLCLSTTAYAYGTGAPDTACNSMKPSHGVDALTTATPYKLQVSGSTYKPGQTITVTINGTEYKGFLLQAREPDTYKIVGTWLSPPNNTKLVACSGSNAVTHANNLLKTGLVYTWMAPQSDAPKKVVFQATVVKVKAEFWMNISSSEFQLDGATSGLKCSACVLFSLLTVSLIRSI
ncbi:putative defense protein 3 [Polyodon spathula]|uniref:putative defense protein 3 n=1 Tax=Polyodon spathula TaxID=7913 RepID=UPI001B7E70E6|nr:putative defense protein 3 [Polyodon spathula]